MMKDNLRYLSRLINSIKKAGTLSPLTPTIFYMPHSFNNYSKATIHVANFTSICIIINKYKICITLYFAVLWHDQYEKNQKIQTICKISGVFCLFLWVEYLQNQCQLEDVDLLCLSPKNKLHFQFSTFLHKLKCLINNL